MHDLKMYLFYHLNNKSNVIDLKLHLLYHFENNLYFLE